MPISSAAVWTASTTSGAKGVGSLVQKRLTPTVTPVWLSTSLASRSSPATSRSRVVASGWRRSTLIVTLPGMVLITFGSAAIRPTVPTAPSTARAMSSTPEIMRAAATRASRRSGIGDDFTPGDADNPFDDADGDRRILQYGALLDV